MTQGEHRERASWGALGNVIKTDVTDNDPELDPDHEEAPHPAPPYSPNSVLGIWVPCELPAPRGCPKATALSCNMLLRSPCKVSVTEPS